MQNQDIAISFGSCLLFTKDTYGRAIYAGHPLDAEVRDGLRGPEYAQPISIGKNCWIGGSAIFLGDDCLGKKHCLKFLSSDRQI